MIKGKDLMEKNKELKKELYTIFWVFVFGCIFGSLVETAYELIVDGTFHVRTGLIYGAFIPVYGAGAVMYYFLVSNIRDVFKVFLSSMALGGFVEYSSSYIQEIFFGTISWEYSEFAFNINGRTSLIHCIFWGAAGVFYITMAYPIIIKFLSGYNKHEFKVLTYAVMIFMIFNIGISCAAGYRQNERVLGINAKNKLDEVLDKYYPDSRMNRIYFNKIITVNNGRNIENKGEFLNAE